MSQALSSQRSWIARIAVLAMVASLMAFGAAPAGAAIDTSASCPSSIPDAGFTDLAGVPAAAVDAINCVADYGISTGTTATTFDPFSEVQRWQMALFLTRQAAVHGVTLPSGADQGFTDLAGVPAAAVTAINQTAQLGISTGTTATTFDPFGTVERWQMALFLTRLITGAGLTLPAGADQGFTDLAGVPAAAVTAINQLGELDIADGTTATTFDPFGAVERWAMALFLTRVLAADGITPTGTYFYVTSVDTANNKFKYSDGSAEVEVTYLDTASFKRNGAAVTLALFETTLNTLDTTGTVGAADGITALKIDPAGLDVQTNVDATSGLIGVVAANEFWFVEPVTGLTIGEVFYGAAAFEFYTVDGTQTTITGLNDNVSVGDTGSLTGGDGTTSAKARTVGVTNGTASGAVTNATAGSLAIGKLSIPDPVAGDTITVDGTTDTAANFLAEVTVGDAATYAKAAGVETFTLTNAAPTPVTGKAVANVVAGPPLTFDVIVNGAAVTVDTTDGDPNTAGAQAWDAVSVDGVLTDLTDFANNLTPGDMVTYQFADTNTSTTSSVSLTNVNGIPTATEVTTINTAGDTLTIELGDGNDNSDSITYVGNALGLSLGTGGVMKYQVNGTAVADATAWENDVNAFISAPSITPKVTLTKVGNDLVWNVTSS